MKIVIVHPNMTSIVDNNQVKVPINDIDSVERSSCLGVHLADCMDYIPYNERDDLLNRAYSKLRKGGELTISGTDLKSIGHYINYNLSSVNQINTSLFSGRLSCDTTNNVLNRLDVMGAELKNVKIDGLYFSIKVIRPNE